MEGCREYEQEIDLKDLLFHVLYRWRSVILAALIIGILSAGYAFGYNMAILPEKRTEVQEELEEQQQLREMLAAQEQGQWQEPSDELINAQQQGLTGEQVTKRIQELEEQLSGLKKLSPVKNFGVGFAAGFFLMAFCYGVGYIFSNKIRGEKELGNRYGYFLLGAVPKPKKGFDRFLEKMENGSEQATEEEVYRIISTNVANLAEEGNMILVTGTVKEEKLTEFVEIFSSQVKNVSVVSGANMNVTASTLEALAMCDAVVLVEERNKSLREKVQREQEHIRIMNKPVLGYVLL